MIIKTLKKGSAKRAREMSQKLLNDISNTYGYRTEGKALYHDVKRTMAACFYKLNLPSDALNSLN